VLYCKNTWWTISDEANRQTFHLHGSFSNTNLIKWKHMENADINKGETTLTEPKWLGVSQKLHFLIYYKSAF
jgi:hypothetical protein